MSSSYDVRYSTAFVLATPSLKAQIANMPHHCQKSEIRFVGNIRDSKGHTVNPVEKSLWRVAFLVPVDQFLGASTTGGSSSPFGLQPTTTIPSGDIATTHQRRY